MPEPAKPPRRTRRALLWTGTAVAALLALHGAAWWLATGQIRSRWPQFIDAARDYGWEITATDLARTGWPWRAAVHANHVRATRLLGEATLRLTFDQLDLALSPIDLKAIRIEAPGTQTVSIGEAPPLAWHAQSATLRIPFDNDAPASMAVRALSATGIGAHGVTVARADATFHTTAAEMSLDGLQTVPPLPAPFQSGGDISVQITVHPAFPIRETPAASAAAWQAAGGRAEIPRLSVRWGQPSQHPPGSPPGPSETTLVGQVAGGLDAALQPQAEGVLEVQGVRQLLEGAAAAGLVARPAAQAAGAVLGIMALGAGPGRAIRLPVRLADAILTIAGFPLARLPRLDWSPPPTR